MSDVPQPASVLVLPVMEPTMTILGAALAVSLRFLRSSRRRLASRKWPRWLVPTLISKPSAVKRGSLAVGRYTAALQTRQSRGMPVRLRQKVPPDQAASSCKGGGVCRKHAGRELGPPA